MEEAEKGNCLHLCSGLSLKSFTKTAAPKSLENLFSKEWNEYRKYKTWIRFPKALKGKFFYLYCKLVNQYTKNMSGRIGSDM